MTTVRSMNLAEAALGRPMRVVDVGGERAFRRRLMELGLLPNTEIELVRVAPLGDPLELRVRGTRLSIRFNEARAIGVEYLAQVVHQESHAEHGQPVRE